MSFLNILPRRALGGLSLVLVALIGLLDYASGWEAAFSVFYLAPILTVTWYIGRRAGILMAFLCAATWGLAYVLAGPVYTTPLTPYWNTGAMLATFLIVVQILSALKSALFQERDLARTDRLTGAANSRAFYEQVELEITRARRYKRTFTVAYLDIDNFKQVNDRLGHSVGDELLRTVAETLTDRLRETDVVARLGGDEFAILFVETGYQVAEMAIERARKALNDMVREHGWPISFSIGAVTCSGNVGGVDSIIKRADELMYQIKRSSKNGLRHERYHVTEQVA